MHILGARLFRIRMLIRKWDIKRVGGRDIVSYVL